MAQEQLLLSAVGAVDQWTLSAGSTKVSACQTPNDDDSSYISSGTTANRIQLFVLDDPGDIGAGDTINYVQVRMRYERLSTPGGSLRIVLYLGGSYTYGNTTTAPASWYDTTEQFTTKPGGGSWTLSDLQNLQAGVQNTQTRNVGCTTVEVIVDYTPAAVTINLAAGSITAVGRAISVDPGTPGPVTINLAAGSITAVGQAISVTSDVLVGLSAGSLVATGWPVSVSAPAAGIEINLAAGSLTATGQALTVTPGPVTVGLSAGALAATGQALTVTPGPVTIGLFAGILTAAGQQISVTAGAPPGSPAAVMYYRRRRA